MGHRHRSGQWANGIRRPGRWGSLQEHKRRRELVPGQREPGPPRSASSGHRRSQQPDAVRRDQRRRRIRDNEWGERLESGEPRPGQPERQGIAPPGELWYNARRNSAGRLVVRAVARPLYKSQCPIALSVPWRCTPEHGPQRPCSCTRMCAMLCAPESCMLCQPLDTVHPTIG